MDKEHVIQFLRTLGTIGIRPADNFVNANCPLAGVTHAGGADSHPSFGVSVSLDKSSVWFCYACNNEPRHLDSLLSGVWQATGVYPVEAAKIYRRYENHSDDHRDTKIEYHDGWEEWSKKQIDRSRVIPEDVINLFPLLHGATGSASEALHKYLVETRNISPEAIRVFGVRYFGQERIIIFPMTDVYGGIKALRARPLTPKSGGPKEFLITPKFVERDWLVFPKIKDTGPWFGLHLLDLRLPVMFVEGCIDAMRVWSLGFKNVIASCTSMVAQAQLNSVHAVSHILGFDSDKAGKDAANRIISLSPGEVMWVADWSFVNRKDAGELESSKELESVLANSRDHYVGGFTRLKNKVLDKRR